MSRAPRQLHLNAFLMSCGHHEAAWRLARSNPFANTDLGHWTGLARIAERGTFDSVFLADSPALWGGPEHRPGGTLEPTVLLTALAGATDRIGLIATASTSYNEPYNLARRFASLDHISGGRAGWNIVTTATRAAAQNFGLDDIPGHAERYRRAAEFTDVSIALWDSWEDGAFAGTPEQVAGTIEEWSRAGAADGFNVMPAALPSGLETFVAQVIPILRGRGLFRTDYAGRTLREHYGIPRPGSQFTARRAATAGRAG